MRIVLNKIKEMTTLLQRETLLIIDKSKKRYLILLGIVALIVIANLNKINVYADDIRQVYLGDFFFFLFKGEKSSSVISEIEFPIFWFLVNIFIIIIIGDNIRSDFKNNGAYLLTRASRKMVFISKMISIFLNIIFYYGIIFAMSIIIGSLSFEYSKYFSYDIIQLETVKMILAIILLYITTSIAIISLYSFLNLLMSEKFSVLIISMFLILSVYIDNIIMFGNNSMIIRQLHLINEGGNGIFNLIGFNIVFAIINCISGVILINNKDIL